MASNSVTESSRRRGHNRRWAISDREDQSIKLTDRSQPIESYDPRPKSTRIKKAASLGEKSKPRKSDVT